MKKATTRNVNPEGLAWPNCMFEPGFVQHLSHEEGMRQVHAALESALQNLRRIILTEGKPEPRQTGSEQ